MFSQLLTHSLIVYRDGKLGVRVWNFTGSIRQNGLKMINNSCSSGAGETEAEAAVVAPLPELLSPILPPPSPGPISRHKSPNAAM